jgi:hypothetical protein
MAVDKALSGILGEPPYVDGPDLTIEVDSDAPMGVEIGEDGVVIDFDPSPVAEDVPFDANLAEYIEESELTVIGLDLLDAYRADRRSREPWEDAYRKGLKLLGLEIEERNEPWPGACGVFHPLLTESVVRFQSHAVMESFPPTGPVKMRVVGELTNEKDKQAKRVRTDMNYIATVLMPEYRPEHERMLFNLALSGSGFKKSWYDPIKQRSCSMYVPPDDLVVSYGTTDLRTSPRFTHVVRETMNTILQRQVVGFYRDVEVVEQYKDYSETEEARAEIAGEEPDEQYDDREVLYECHVEFDMPEPFDDPDGIARPYVITFTQTGKVLSIYRNWREDDPTYKPRQHFSHYLYLPGPGFYGIGLIHLLGGLTKSSTSILRQLVDAGTLANLPGGFKAKGFRVKGEDEPIAPAEWRDVDIPGEKIADSLYPLPYKEPSTVLYQLLGTISDEGRRLGSIAEMDIPTGGQETPVGTMLAWMERALKVMSAVQSRLHNSMAQELQILHDIIRDYMPAEYPFDTDPGATRTMDYDGRVDVIPVSDPNASTMAQKVVCYQVAMTSAQQAPPGTYNMSELHRGLLEALNMPNAEKIIPIEDDLVNTDPVSENMRILTQEAVKVFPQQDHEAHIRVHMAAMQDPKIAAMIGQNPAANAIMAAAHAHVTEHVAHQYRREIEKMIGAPIPNYGDTLPEDVEKSVSKLMADAADRVLEKDRREAQAMEAARKAQDPIIKMQQEELALKKQKQADDKELKNRELDIREKEIRSDDRQVGAKIGADLVKAGQADVSKKRIAGVKAGIDVLKIQAEKDKDNADGGSSSED